MQDTTEDMSCAEPGRDDTRSTAQFRERSTAATVSARTDAAAEVWSQLAGLLAASPRVRLWRPDTGFAVLRPLTKQLPVAPAAVPIYRSSRGRAGRRVTRLLVLDCDAKAVDSATVLNDYVRLAHWIEQAGGRFVADVSTSGGRHLIVPLKHSVSVDDLRPLLSALAARCTSLDTTPMLNDVTGCITAPGSVCREGGHRQLIGSISEALDALAERSAADFLTRFGEIIGAPVAIPSAGDPGSALSRDVSGALPDPSSVFEGRGDQRRLRPSYRRNDPIHPAVAAFAQSGVLPADRRWLSRSEARQSAIVAAVQSGMTLVDLLTAIAPSGPWCHGLGAAYARRPSRRKSSAARRPDPLTTARRLRRDWEKACRWVEHTVQVLQHCTHKTLHTGGGGEVAGTLPAHRLWLANASWWCSFSLRSQASRTATLTVLQAVAVMAARTGQAAHGVPTVGVGGRSLSLAAGLLSESAVWSALRRLRDLPGSPLLLIRKGSGPDADLYALVTPDLVDPRPDAPGRPTVSPVHPAWIVVGHHHRRIYELVIAGLTTAEALSAAAHASRSSVYASLAELQRHGLITRTRGHIGAGKVHLDDLAEAHRLDEEREQRIADHQHARHLWRQWLQTRRDPGADTGAPAAVTPPAELYLDGYDTTPCPEYLAAVLATGPPPPW